jgi:exosome complex RNA-binding protein Rrp4
MVKYYKDRIDALVRKVKELEHLLELKQTKIEKLKNGTIVK